MIAIILLIFKDSSVYVNGHLVAGVISGFIWDVEEVFLFHQLMTEHRNLPVLHEWILYNRCGE